MQGSLDLNAMNVQLEHLRRGPAERSCIFLSSLLANKWALPIIYEACKGTTKFSLFGERLAVVTTSLTRCLASLVDLGIMERRLYSNHPPRWEYVLTADGETIRPAIELLSAWAEQHLAKNGSSLSAPAAG